jgi:long-chain acyl-CoA synthetase
MIERVLSHVGGRVRIATSGGAKLPDEVGEYLEALGLTVLGAYGLTEHLCATMHRADRYNFDSAGVAMPGTRIRIAEDGEVLLQRSPLTFSGYHGRPEESRAAFDSTGEWLHTGDLGDIDPAGFLRITGRKKELIALSTGKKVAPLRIEAKLMSDPWISQAILLGEGRKYLVALLTLRREVVESWAGEHGLKHEYVGLLGDPAVIARVQAAVDEVNADFSGPEQIRRFHLLERELTLESGELTPTLKVRRTLVLERYHTEIEALYAGGVQ